MAALLALAPVIYWTLGIAGAALSCLVSACKFVDWRRHKTAPTRHEYGASSDLIKSLPLRPAPVMAGKRMERVARYKDVAHRIRTGDGGKYSGRRIFSYLVRFFTYSDASHWWAPYVDEEGVWIVDSCEGRGVTKRLLYDEVKAHPGQYYWAAIAPEFRDEYKRGVVGGALLADLGCPYGWFGIVLQCIIHCPVLRELAYVTKVDRLFAKLKPFCSGFGLIKTRLGGIDPVKGRDPQLVTPQDMSQSPVYGEWVALIP